MIEFGGMSYFIDLTAVDKVITIPVKEEKTITKVTKKTIDKTGEIIQIEEIESEVPNTSEIDGVKLDLIRTFVDVLMDNMEDVDSSLGATRALENMDLNYQIAFNTLFKYKILKVIE